MVSATPADLAIPVCETNDCSHLTVCLFACLPAAQHCSNNWLLDRPQLALARKEDLRHASRLECAAVGVFFANRECSCCISMLILTRG